jgi:hypothetical protein
MAKKRREAASSAKDATSKKGARNERKESNAKSSAGPEPTEAMTRSKEPMVSLPDGEPMGSLPPEDCSGGLRMEAMVVPRRSVEEWGTLIKEDLGRAIEGIVSAGLHLEQAFAQLGKGRYGEMLEAIKLHSETAKRLRRIANNSALRNPEHYARLPVSMRTLSELASIAAPTLEVYIASGVVHVGLEREDAEVLRHAPPPPDKPSLEQMEARQAENAEAEARELEQKETADEPSNEGNLVQINDLLIRKLLTSWHDLHNEIETWFQSERKIDDEYVEGKKALIGQLYKVADQMMNLANDLRDSNPPASAAECEILIAKGEDE